MMRKVWIMALAAWLAFFAAVPVGAAGLSSAGMESLLAGGDNGEGREDFAETGSGVTEKGVPGDLAGGSSETGKRTVRFSEWEKTGTTDYSSDIYKRNVHVSDGGNYLLTSREIIGDRYRFTFDIIYEGEGTQTVYTKDMDSVEVGNGKLFRIESMDECGLEIDQIIDGDVWIRESTGSSFILLYRQNGGEEDGKVRTIPVIDGSRAIDTDYYKGMTSVDLLGVLRFREEDRSALGLSANVIQHDTTSFVIQQAFTSEEPDGIALFSYTQSNGREVSAIQIVYDGLGVFTCYDSAENVEDIVTGNFRILGYNYHWTEAETG